MIDSLKSIVYEDALSWTDVEATLLAGQKSQKPTDKWEAAMEQLLVKTPTMLRGQVERICVSGTSSSVLLYDQAEQAVSRQPRMYDFNVLQQCADATWGARAIAAIRGVCPAGSAANAATSTLAKVLSWHYEEAIKPTERVVHQADYLVHHLVTSGTLPTTLRAETTTPTTTHQPAAGGFHSDWHNALKLGYDVYNLAYPPWLLDLLQTELGTSPDGVAALLPQITEPGRAVSALSQRTKELGYDHPDCRVVAGTTDSIAAFLASGADSPGQAVTSLGSTVAIKLLSETPVEDSSRGIYSHRLGDRWLVGGASNVGCAVLRQELFSEQELAALSSEIDPTVDSPLAYYPLLKIGERFPISNPNKEPLLDPKPTLPDGSVCRKQYLYGILQAIAEVEREGYAALRELGATPVTEVLTAGGGSRNDMWMRLRQRLLRVPTSRAANVDAAYGCARLAAKYHVEGAAAAGSAGEE